MQFWARGIEGLQLKSKESRFLSKRAERCCVLLRAGYLPAVRAVRLELPRSQPSYDLQPWDLCSEITMRVQLWRGAASQGLVLRGSGICHQGPGFIKHRTVTLGLLSWQAVTEVSEKTGELKSRTVSRNRDRSEVVYLVTQGVNRKALMQKYIKCQGETVEKSAKVRTGHFQWATKASSSSRDCRLRSPHRPPSASVSSTEHINVLLKSNLVPATYCIKPKITLLHTHK